MQFTLLTSLCALVASVSAIQINYYSDGGCENFITSPPNVPIGRCYDYAWDGQNSANIANCDSNVYGCKCYFYAQAGCKGAVDSANTGSYDGTNCVSNWGHGFKSFHCFVDHGL
ncbi:hypothetical protein P170DRAFT_427449 [Aspergillus steynii IBT 23096]|uniref:Small secreted protein n=1 Tax=Aspergillus steynii IBT 23096 TaxID=1392250 RepID=A0A2I2G659_9EURO|nr:uncharacterized protein P170DRAFT_427449 [Aspergillus steynii IBT 23096]PLB48362.1 hypothetical protein P170DRAFT_427449 [Aspergillus steynii IBT 23096]